MNRGAQMALRLTGRRPNHRHFMALCVFLYIFFEFEFKNLNISAFLSPHAQARDYQSLRYNEEGDCDAKCIAYS